MQKQDSDSDKSQSFKNSIILEKLDLAKSRSRREEEMLQIRKDEAQIKLKEAEVKYMKLQLEYQESKSKCAAMN